MNKAIYEFWKEKGIDDSVLLPIMDRLEKRNKIILDLDKKYHPTGCSWVSCARKKGKRKTIVSMSLL